MKRNLVISLLSGFLAVVTAPPALACAACYGASDSPLAQGMNWGIVTLLAVIGSVLFGIAAFFVHVGIKSARMSAHEQSQNQTENSNDGIL